MADEHDDTQGQQGDPDAGGDGDQQGGTGTDTSGNGERTGRDPLLTKQPDPDGSVKLSADEYALLTGFQSKANREALDRRKALTQKDKDIQRLQKELDDLKSANATEAEKAVMQAKKDGETEAENRWRPKVVRQSAASALIDAGCLDAADRKLLLSQIDVAKVETNPDGEVTGGLDEQIAALKQEHPRMFEPAKPRVPSARQVDAGDKPAPKTPESATQKQLKRLGLIP